MGLEKYWEQMGLENIREANGLGISATGMLIVFVALMLIAVFISLLPKVLQCIAFLLPPEQQAHSHVEARSNGDEEIVAAIGFALHQREVEKHRTS